MAKLKLTRKKVIILLTAILLIIGTEIGVAVAFVATQTQPAANEFTPMQVECSIVENVQEGRKKSVKIQNSNGPDAAAIYVRAAVVANNVDAYGNILPGMPDISDSISASNMGTDWVKIGMYYYYTIPLAKGESSANLLASSIDLSDIQVTILAEAIQAEPAAAASEAWGVAVGSDGNITGPAN